MEIKQGPLGGAKGGKGRTVYMGRASRRALWLYLSKREDGREPDAPLFVARGRRPLSRGTLRLMVTRMGKKAGVQNAYLRKFRHTFAITYLRSGGDVFTLQQLLGHGSLDMVRHYALDRNVGRGARAPQGEPGGQLEVVAGGGVI